MLNADSGSRAKKMAPLNVEIEVPLEPALADEKLGFVNSGRGGTPSKFRWLTRAQMPDFGHITGIYTDTKLPAIYFVCSSYV